MQKLNYPPELVDNKLGQDLTRQISRRWREGDIYAPHDLSEVEMAKWKKRTRPDFDVFDVLNFKPLDHYKVFSHLRCFCFELRFLNMEGMANNGHGRISRLWVNI